MCFWFRYELFLFFSSAQQTFLVSQDFFKTSSVQQFFVFQDVLKTSSRCVWNMSSKKKTPSRGLCMTSSRRFQDVFDTSSKRSSRRVYKMSSSRRLQDVFRRRLAVISWRSQRKKYEDKEMSHWIRLQDLLKTSSVRLHQGEC